MGTHVNRRLLPRLTTFEAAFEREYQCSDSADAIYADARLSIEKVAAETRGVLTCRYCSAPTARRLR